MSRWAIILMKNPKITPQRFSAAGRVRSVAVGLAVVSALVLSGCTAASVAPTTTPIPRPDLKLSLGALMPTTGALAAFGPSAQAGIDLAVKEINDANVGITVSSVSQDSADAASDIAIASTTALLAKGVTVIVGAISDGVSKKVIDQIVKAGVLEISPGNSSLDFSRYADNHLYWRTSPSCAREGEALGKQIADTGVKTLGLIYEKGYCEPGLPEAIADAFERAGGKVVARTAFDAASANLTAQVAEIVAKKPAAVAVVTPTAAKLAVPDLAAAGYAGDKLYFTGLSISDHSADFAAGSLTGATASLPGINISTLKGFTDRLLAVNPALKDFSYAAETYDAVMLVALAALAAGNTSGGAISDKLEEVSGGTGNGEKATGFKKAARIILEGKIVDYDGPSGPIAFDANGDPTDAIIGMYTYGANNTFTRIN